MGHARTSSMRKSEVQVNARHPGYLSEPNDRLRASKDSTTDLQNDQRFVSRCCASNDITIGMASVICMVGPSHLREVLRHASHCLGMTSIRSSL